ncbi:ATP-dependent zinc metalloprotease FtsH [Actinomadura sp. ATCC 31491]|uniref:ATP-dependent zinc metalloprotease FtsH n=1 Tax=Actinomadura luzonensis TaxID=2805427 RepID=A0ABT0FX34_9ACTN|nr:ATP-dependent zinc metalloprotease FtsH [Actinomadura luzonensis]MCK2216908.1 ATP-dependent zinc metalloprotease FtsH [Actinomadura luzonensis]
MGTHSHPTGTAKPGPEKKAPAPPPEEPAPKGGRWLWIAGLLVLVAWLAGPMLLAAQGGGGARVPYSDFIARVDAGQVQAVTVDDAGAATVTLRGGDTVDTQIPTALGVAGLESRLAAHRVTVTATSSSGTFGTLLMSFLPLILMVGVFWWLMRRGQNAFAGGMGGFGRSRAKIIEAERPATRFADVAGYEGVKQEIGEVVDFLRAPERYAAAGAKPPRGVIMVGPPGTGKTLLARAVAGEAEVPFLSVTGSGFVEMFVGVGASRVRDLFDEARRRAPSIVFIDEIDAIGGRRGSIVTGGGNDEREQTLNQLLAEMDGFDQSSGIVVLAATNRPQTLDAALLRPGRFDRQVTVPLPTQGERAAILAVHAGGKHLAPEVDLGVLARATPGFSGADLANLVNEAAINAVRDGRTTITVADFDAARDRVLLGRRETSNALLPQERRAVAVHESGHALIAALCEHADPVAKVTILPAGLTLGVTEQLPEAERHLYSESYLRDLLAVRLGGRAAELVVLGEGSTGAANDLAGATQIATRMVRDFGLSGRLGPVGYGSDSLVLDGGDDSPLRRGYSEHTQRLIDQEVALLLRTAEQRAAGLLRAHRAALDRLTGLLIEQETVDGDAVTAVLRATRTEAFEPFEPAPAAAGLTATGA